MTTPIIDAAAFAERNGLVFHDISLLQQALTHRSYLNEDKSADGHNERLEFLGDAVLELVVTDYLYRNHDNPEGDLTAWRASLVNTEMLAVVADGLGMDEALRMSKGEAKDDNRRARRHLLANAVEAVIGAAYLDRGYEAARDFVLAHVVTHLGEVLEKKLYRDAKSFFQESAQRHRATTPHYAIIEQTGPDHDRQFVVGAYIGSELAATGTGRSKQEAQRAAAEAALAALGWDKR